MPYKALYRKYRPQKFNQVIGQDHIVTTLSNIVKTDKVSHAYLFAGPRGTGKTSVAHIFANKINKIDVDDTSYQNSFDIVEIDAASNNGVTEIRRLIDNANYLPTKYKYKVYIIDEVHMLTRGAFNALLKTLEEPSSHLIFILATTEPHKIPTTILSRTQRFNFKRINNELMVENLRVILKNELISFEEEAIKLIAHLAQGGMRDCLSIADQIASYGNNKISFVAISQIFGIISVTNQIKIINLIYEKKTKDVLIMINDFISNGIDIERLINSFVDIAKDFIIYQKTNDIKLCSILTLADMNLINISVPFAYKLIEELIDSIKYIQFSEMKRQIFEISLLKLFSTDEDLSKVQKIHKTIENISKKSENNNKSNVFTQQELVKEDENKKAHLENDGSDKNVVNDNKSNVFTQQELVKEDENKKAHLENDSSDKNVVDDNSSQYQENAPEKDILESYVSKISHKIQTETINDQRTYTVKELINYLRHTDKNKLTKFKMALPNVINWIDKVENKNHITLLQNAKIISGGENFIIISSDDDFLISALKREINKQNFIDLTSAVLGEPVDIIVISKYEFEKLKEEWKKLVSSHNLPPKYAIKTSKKFHKTSTSNIEKYGEKVFGKTFEKKEK